MKALAIFTLIACFYIAACNTAPSDGLDKKSFLDGSELQVNGRSTNFNSHPPVAVEIHKSHPRLMFNESDIDQLRSKLNSAEYAEDKAYLSSKKAAVKYGGSSIQAFRWQLFRDEQARDWAKQQLLAGNIAKWGHPFYDNQWLFAWATTYDWLSDSLTQEEKRIAWMNAKQKMGGNISGYDQKTFAKPFEFNHNDSWGKERYPYEAAVAIAIQGDGVDDDLANSILENSVAGHQSFLSPQGMLDWMNLMALDSGGSQASRDEDNVTGYSGMYAFPCMLFHGYWESATHQKMWEQSNFFRYFPLWNAYDNDSPLGLHGQAVMEVVAGRYRESDPEMAGLAAWYLNLYGPKEIHNTLLLPRLIWGDKRVKPLSPTELKLPLAKHLRGADCFVSRSSWESDATVVNVATRTLDHLRYEPDPGVISIYQAGKPILVDTRKGKWRRRPSTASGVMLGQGISSMYWKPPHQWIGSDGRPQQPFSVASHAAYFPDCTEDYSQNELYNSVRLRYDHLSLDPVIHAAYRAVIHIHDDPQFVVVIDDWQTDQSVETAITWRLTTSPTISNNTFVWGESAASVFTESSAEIKWIGGVGHEFERPDGSWAGDKKDGDEPGYSESKSRAEKMGIGSVYVTGKGSNRCVTVIAINSKEPAVLTRNEGVIAFSGYELTLKDQAKFDLAKQGSR